VGDHARGATVAAGRPAHTQVDAAGKHRLEHHELLEHLERAVVGQHHAAGTQPHPSRHAAQAREHHLGAGVAHPVQPVVLGAPVARVAELVGQRRAVEAVAHPEIRNFAGLREAVPRAHQLAIVAAVDTVAHQRAQ